MHTIKTLQTYQSLSEHEKLYTYIDERAVCTIPTIALNEDIIDLRNIAPEHMHFDNAIPNTFVRKTLAEKLLLIQKELESHGYGLHIFELYRDIQIQEEQFTEIQMQFAKERPNLSPEELWELTTQFIADPALTPPHCTGGAVDLTLYTIQSGEFLDMGCPNNDLTEKAQLMCSDLSQEAKANRIILLRAMLGQNLAPMPTEWWHYSYGEKYWAAFYNTHALYDVIRI